MYVSMDNSNLHYKHIFIICKTANSLKDNGKWRTQKSTVDKTPSDHSCPFASYSQYCLTILRSFDAFFLLVLTYIMSKFNNVNLL